MPHPVRSTITFILSLFFIFYVSLYPALAVGNLTDAHDYINKGAVDSTDVEHSIGFTLPQNAAQVSSTDYIIIDMSNFSDVTEAQVMTGDYSGTPSFSLVGSIIKITGIVILPGGTVTIGGITATNPGSQNQYYLSVAITEDEAGTIIKNVASFQAAPFGGNIAVTASIEAPVAALDISGYTAPGTFVTFTENGAVIGTDSAGPTGLFSQVFNGLQPGDHTISLYGVDASGRTTSILTLEVYTPIYQQTSVSNLLLSPTIQISATQIQQGDDLIVSGTAVPSGDLTIFTESPLRSYYATVDSSGDWDYTITNTSEYIPSDYIVYSLVQSGSLQSLVSTALGFQVSSTGVTPTPAGCDVSQGDLNCDDNINLTDFSILMFYWGTTQPAGDINSDGSVNLIDFSIMMFYWGT